MRIIASVAGLLLLTGSLFAGSQEIIKQRAKDVRNQNNANQGVPMAPTVATQPAAPLAPSVKNMAALDADLAAVSTGSPATEEQKQKISQDLISAATGSYKPSAPSSMKLAADLVTVFSQKAIPAASRAKLIQELDAILNPAKYPSARLEGIYADIPNAMDRHGVNRRQAMLLTESLKVVAAECRGQAAPVK